MKDITEDVVKTLEFINQLMLDHDYEAARSEIKRIIRNLSTIPTVQYSEYIVFKRSDIMRMVDAIECLSEDVGEIEP
jgi:uncharacterized protein (DUF1499 family)